MSPKSNIYADILILQRFPRIEKIGDLVKDAHSGDPNTGKVQFLNGHFQLEPEITCPEIELLRAARTPFSFYYLIFGPVIEGRRSV